MYVCHSYGSIENMIKVDLLLLSGLGTSGATLAGANHSTGHVNLMLLRPIGIFLTDWFVILDLVPKELDVLLVLMAPMGAVLAVVGFVNHCGTMLLFRWGDHVADRLHLALRAFVFGFYFLEHHFLLHVHVVLFARCSCCKGYYIITSTKNTIAESEEGKPTQPHGKEWARGVVVVVRKTSKSIFCCEPH